MATTRQEVDALNSQITKLNIKMKGLRDRCDHSDKITTYKSDTGNYDPSEDRYWKDIQCQICGRFWQEDQ